MYTALNNYFDKVYILTLEKATERHAVFAKLLNGLNYEIVYGIDKETIDVDTLIEENKFDAVAAKKVNTFKREFRLGEIACSMGHNLMYQKIIEHNYQKVLILEDDVIPNIEAISNFEKIINQVPKDWDLCYLGFFKFEIPPKNAFWKKLDYSIKNKLGLHKWNAQIIKNLYPTKINEHISKAGFHDCTHAYMLNAKAAKVLLEMQTPIKYLSDNALSYAIVTEKLNGYITNPKFFNQPFQLDVNGEQESYIR